MSAQRHAPSPRRQNRDGSGNPRPVGSRKVVALRLVGGGIALWALLSLVGVSITHVLSSGQTWDRGVSVWFAAHRTSTWNMLSGFGSHLSDTSTAIAVTVIVVLLLRWRLHRWYESWVVVAAIAGELFVFLAVTATVHRPRPPVPRLDSAPPTSSFPSGHTAAAIALYGCMAVLLFWVYGRRAATVAGAVVLLCIPVVVGFSRLYRGMHYPSDVVAGALGGGIWLLIVVSTLLPRRGAGQGAVAQGRGT